MLCPAAPWFRLCGFPGNVTKASTRYLADYLGWYCPMSRNEGPEEDSSDGGGLSRLTRVGAR